MMKDPKEMTERELQENLLSTMKDIDTNLFKLIVDTQQIQRSTNTIKIIVIIAFVLTIIAPFAFLFLGLGALIGQ